MGSPDVTMYSSVSGSSSEKLVVGSHNTVSPASANLQRVPENCSKESIPCVLSLLGFHLPAVIKDNIWQRKFIGILSLLPSCKEFIFKSEKAKANEDKRRSVARYFFYLASCILHIL